MKWNVPKRPTINQAVKEAGGQYAVAKACGVSQPTCYAWTRNGLPRTEWTGETDYSTHICRLANANPKKTQHWYVDELKTRDADERTAAPVAMAG